jgi:hypothetical protein
VVVGGILGQACGVPAEWSGGLRVPAVEVERVQ